MAYKSIKNRGKKIKKSKRKTYKQKGGNHFKMCLLMFLLLATGALVKVDAIIYNKFITQEGLANVEQKVNELMGQANQLMVRNEKNNNNGPHIRITPNGKAKIHFSVFGLLDLLFSPKTNGIKNQNYNDVNNERIELNNKIIPLNREANLRAVYFTGEQLKKLLPEDINDINFSKNGLSTPTTAIDKIFVPIFDLFDGEARYCIFFYEWDKFIHDYPDAATYLYHLHNAVEKSKRYAQTLRLPIMP
jgi:hypothetical protein